MANKDLFKQAIAEAKSVREAAIANAKEALEETLTPHLKDMLAAKLQEMDDSSTDEEVVKEIEGDVEEGMDKDKKDEAIDEDFTFEEEEVDAELEAEDDSEESDEEAQEDVEVKDMEVSDLKDLIRDIIAQEMGDDLEGEELPADELPSDDMVAMDDEEEIDLDELLREITEMNHDQEYNEGPVTPSEEGEGASHSEVEEVSMHTRTPENNDLVKAIDFIGKHAKKAGKSVADFVKNIEVGKMSDAMKEAETEDHHSELEEAMTTIEALKGQLQEVNLLNAKLLYVNKVFKANSLSESQKVSVIAAFDKAETVKEVKLVFETVSDNVVGRPSKGTIKEAKLGMASKATGITASKPAVITEASEAVRRMQKLAGIIK